VKKLQARGLVQLRRIIEQARRAEQTAFVSEPAPAAQTTRRIATQGAA
jgi:hypothetical protein